MKNERTRFFGQWLPILALVAIVVIGASLRLYALGQPSFWNDESDTALQSLGILKNGIPILPSGRVEYEAVLSPALTALAWLIGGQSDFAARFVDAVFGIATIFVVFLLGRKASGTGVGLSSSLMYSLSSWMVAWSRQARFYQEFQFFFLALALILLSWPRNKKEAPRKLILLAGVLLFLSALSSYHSVLLFVSLAISWAGLKWGPRLVGYLRRQSVARLVVGTACCVLAVSVVFWLGLVDFTARSLLVLVGRATGEFFTIVPDNRLSYHETFEPFLFHQHPYVVSLAVFGAILLGLKNLRTAITLVVLFLVPYVVYSTLFASFTLTVIYARYVFPETPVLFIFASVAVMRAASSIAYFLSRNIAFRLHGLTHIRVRLVVSIGLVLLMVFAPSSGFVPRVSSLSQLPEPQPNYKMAASYLKTMMMPGDVVGAMWPENTYYYLGRTEYWLVSNALSIQLSGIPDGPYVRYYYTGSIVIKDPQEMNLTMTSHPRGWLILSASDIAGLSPDLWNLIKSMHLNADGSDSTILTFSWDTTKA